MSQSLFLEALNGAFFVLALCAAFVFVHYIWTNRKDGYPAIKPAVPLAFMMVGEATLRGSLWWARQKLNEGIPTKTPELQIAVGAVIVIIGLLCIIRVFAPDRWGYWSWVVPLAITIAFVSFSISS